ncbi:MAG: AcrB/AcrD/AcrF family protein [Pseudomonadota bacterium]
MRVNDGHGSLRTIVERDWVKLCLIAWAVVAAFYLWDRWAQIQWLSLGDTDDNMRLMQVRALLDGQGWYDLRQYRMNPPVGFDMHWTRLVDLPIAGLILLFQPLVGTAQAERLAVGIAPLLPLALAMIASAFTARRLVAPAAWPLAAIFLLGATAAMLMFAPLRIDHHGWQLACLAASVAGLVDPQRGRGGVVVGLASALSLTIGLELLPYAVMAGAIVTLRWVIDRDDAKRLQAYALALTGGVTAGFGGFASIANQVARCDALTPVYLTTFVAAGTLLFLVARVSPAQRGARLGLAVGAGAIVAGGFVLLFPQCLGRPEQVSPELAANWLNNVREAKPIYAHTFRLGFTIAALPVIGLIGAALATWRARGSDRIAGWLPVLLFTAFACGMMLWQVRAGPAAQLLAVPGAVALAWLVLPWFLRFQPNARTGPAPRGVFAKVAAALATAFPVLVRVAGTAIAFLVVSGLFAGLAVQYLPIDPPSKRTRTVNRANGQCFAGSSLRALNAYPATTILTFTDLGPRLITMTHHNAVAGPYHRNEAAILDVQHAFTGSDGNVRATAARHGATLLLVCPNMAESTVYRVRGKGGFYDRLAHNRVPPWLERLPLPKKSPFRLYRIRS